MTEQEQKLDSLSKELSAFQLRFFNEFLPKINALDLQKLIALEEKIRSLDAVFNNMGARIDNLETKVKKLEDKSPSEKQFIWEKTDTKPWYRRFLK